MEPTTPENQTPKPQTEKTDKKDHTKAGLAYLLSFLSGIFFLLTEKENNYVKFHAAQSTILGIALYILSFLLDGALMMLATLVFLVLAFMVYQGKDIRIPVIADYADKLKNKFSNPPSPPAS
jgi:uncharacterized membrane protein